MNGNVPSVLSKAMGMEKKPFTYLPGGIDFSELKSPKMQKRINKHMQGGNGQTSDQSVMITYTDKNFVVEFLDLTFCRYSNASSEYSGQNN